MKIWAIYKKEMRVYFTTPLAYVLLFIFMFVMGFFFWLYFSNFARASMQPQNPMMAARDLSVTEYVMRPLFSGFLSVILFLSLVPAITMRLVAEERRNGTLELLMTYPVHDGAVVLSKFLGALSLYTVMLVTTLAYPAIVRFFTPLEWGALGTLYLGMLLMGAAFMAVGLFVSSLTENQIVAALGTFMILLLLWAIGWPAESAGGWFGTIFRHISISEHLENFTRGVIETKDVVYFVDLTAAFLIFSLLSLQSRRWRG
jgi:ABC-2 type transport system permease protein